jgi:hypothetical protein
MFTAARPCFLEPAISFCVPTTKASIELERRFSNLINLWGEKVHPVCDHVVSEGNLAFFRFFDGFPIVA